MEEEKTLEGEIEEKNALDPSWEALKFMERQKEVGRAQCSFCRAAASCKGQSWGLHGTQMDKPWRGAFPGTLCIQDFLGSMEITASPLGKCHGRRFIPRTLFGSLFSAQPGGQLFLPGQ